jgi:NADP-dependent 3-hydroxy acid dehydrogenase YdfG
MKEQHALNRRVALVTGASSGIGRAVCLALAKTGARLAIVARRIDSLADLKGTIEELGGEAFPLAVDLRDQAGIKSAFESVSSKWNGIDILVNSAGLGRVAPLSSGQDEDFREMLEVNALALAIVTREAVASMQSRNVAGHIVHVSSMSAYRVQGDTGMYAATKHAVRAMTEGLRQELRQAGSPIRISSVSPANTDTGFMDRMLGKKKAREKRPEYRQLDPEDVADAVLYLLSTPAHVEVNDILIRPTNQPD